MPQVSNELGAQYWEPVATGPVAQADLSSWSSAMPPATIVASGSWVSSVLPGDGFKVLSVGVTLSQTGTLKIQRYIDAAGTVKQGAASTQSLTAATPAVLNVTDGLPFRTFTIEIDNSGASTANVSGFACLMNAA